MFLACFRRDIYLDNKSLETKDVIIKQRGNYYILISKYRNKVVKMKKELLTQKLINQYDNLIDDSIFISPITITVNTNKKFKIAYDMAKKIFINELLDELDGEKYINYYNADIINLPDNIDCPTKFNHFTQQKYKIKFRKTIFLQDRKFVNEFNALLQNKRIEFEKITKFIWKKLIFPKNPDLPQGQNK